MRVTVLVGSEKLRIPVDDGSRTIAWLQADIIKRWEKRHKGEYLHINEIRTSDNIRLDNEDQIFGVCREDESLVVILGTGTEKEVGPGDMINQYYLSSQIGEGTYGRVYKAHDLNLNRLVAVKVLRREKANEVNTRRFLREAELNGSLSTNPYVVTVHDFGRTRGGTLFIVMELLKGRPLNELLDERINAKQPFSVLEVIHIISPVLRGLHAAHTHNPCIVHRDVKPDNIWLNDVTAYQHSSRPSDHLTKILDFGIAKHDEITHETLACGTRMYSSPEQTRKNAKLDGRSDVWSVGVIMYQMFSLLVDVPFDPIEIILNKQVVPPLSLHTVTPLSDHMHKIVMRALETDPAKRFASAEEMGDALHREEARLLDGIKNPTTAFQAHDATATATTQQKSNFSRPPGSSPVASPSSTSTSTASSVSAASSSSSSSSSKPIASPPSSSSSSSSASAASSSTTPNASLHPRYQRQRSKVPFASDQSNTSKQQQIKSKL